MEKMNLVLVGFGHVGKAFFRLIGEKREICRSRYGVDPVLVGIFRKRGGCDRIPGWDEQPAVELVWRPELKLEALLSSAEPGILVECTPGFAGTGDPGLSHIRAALTRGWHVVTANKAPLIADWSGLFELSKAHRRRLGISGTTAAALPTLDVARYALAGAEIERIEGILNGTSNYILTQIRKGRAFDEALREAQAGGIAEPDPRNDVEGWDTAYKILLLANAVYDQDFSLDDIDVKGITDLEQEQIQSGRGHGRALKLIGRISRESEAFKLEVRPQLIDESHPLFGVNDTEKGITFWTDTMSVVTVKGGKSDPRGTAAALLKDILHIGAGI